MTLKAIFFTSRARHIMPPFRDANTYSSHRNGKGCRLPARPKENTQDELCCETCHRTFESPRANDFHEPCKAAVNYVPQRKNKRTYHTSSPMTSTVIQHDVRLPPEATDDNTKLRITLVRLSTIATNRLATICRAALRKPNVDGTYYVNGQVMSLQELERQIGNLSRHQN